MVSRKLKKDLLVLLVGLKFMPLSYLGRYGGVFSHCLPCALVQLPESAVPYPLTELPLASDFTGVALRIKRRD